MFRAFHLSVLSRSWVGIAAEALRGPAVKNGANRDKLRSQRAYRMFLALKYDYLKTRCLE